MLEKVESLFFLTNYVLIVTNLRNDKEKLEEVKKWGDICVFVVFVSLLACNNTYKYSALLAFGYVCTVLRTVIQICLRPSKFSRAKCVQKPFLCFQTILVSLYIWVLRW